MDSQHLGPEHQSLWQMLWATPMLLLTLFFRGLREWIGDKIGGIFKRKTEDLRQNTITREEFEPRMKAVTEEIHFVHTDLSEKLLAHGAQARQDNRDLRHSMEERDKVMYDKIDGFMTQVLLNQRTK